MKSNLVKESLNEDYSDKGSIYMVCPSGDSYDESAIGLIYAISPRKAKEGVALKLGLDLDDMKYYSAFELDKREYKELLELKKKELKHAQHMFDMFNNIIVRKVRKF